MVGSEISGVLVVLSKIYFFHNLEVFIYVKNFQNFGQGRAKPIFHPAVPRCGLEYNGICLILNESVTANNALICFLVILYSAVSP